MGITPNGEKDCLGVASVFTEPPKPSPNGEFACFPGAVNFGNSAPCFGAAPAPKGEATRLAPTFGGAPNPAPTGEAACLESVVATFPSCSLDVSGGASYEVLLLIVEGGLIEL